MKVMIDLIVPADKSTFVRARSLQISDFEDAVVASAAEAYRCNFIVTRNVPDFVNSPITPEEFVRRYASLDEDSSPE